MNTITKNYSEIEKKISPFVKFLEEEKENTKYKGLYKGIITLQSPIIANPEILFIGLNPGPGAFVSLNKDLRTKNSTPLRMLGEEEMCFKELNWYEKGNARAKKKGGWKAYEWYETDKPVNNPFTIRMIDLLDKIAKLKYPEESNTQTANNDIPFWFNDFGQKIMATNLYPISTTNFTDLQKIHRKLAKEDSLRQEWVSLGNNQTVNEWLLRRYFIGLTYELIDLVKPKVIVCLGKQAFHDFTYKGGSKGKISLRKIERHNNSYNVIGFSRRGNWSPLLNDLAKEIVKYL